MSTLPTRPGKVLGIIPARGGSKGIPGKNIRLLGGKPLLAYSVEVARASGVIDRLILSTDSEQIALVGRQFGAEVPFLRPAELAADDTSMQAVLEHALATLDEQGWRAEIVVLLQPTAPLRRPEHIVEAIEILHAGGCDSVASVVELPRHHSPDYVMRIDDGLLCNFLPRGDRVTRRQDARRAYSRDGTVYGFWRQTLIAKGSIYGDTCRPLLIEAEASVNIDTPADWDRAERLIQGRGEPA